MRRPAPLLLPALALLLLAGCGDDGDGASELEAQVAAVVAAGADDVQARLDALGVAVEHSALTAVDEGDVRCPRVDAPAAGDRATCELALDVADVLVDVEFAEDGAVTVIGVEVRQVAPGDEDVEGAVAEVVAAGIEGGGADLEVSCPGADVPSAGERVRCQVAGGGADPVRIELAVDDDGTLVLDTAVLDRVGVEAFLAEQLAEAAGGDVEVRCGDGPLLASPVDGVLSCEAERLADGATFDVQVRAESVDGELSYVVSGD